MSKHLPPRAFRDAASVRADAGDANANAILARLRPANTSAQRDFLLERVLGTIVFKTTIDTPENIFGEAAARSLQRRRHCHHHHHHGSGVEAAA